QMTRVVLLVLFAVLFMAAAPARWSPLVQPLAAQEQDDGGWDFEEEEEVVPTFMDEVRAQAVDIAAVAAFTVLAFVSFFRKSERRKAVLLVAAVGCLGLYESQLISSVTVFGLLGGNLPLFCHNLSWYLLAIVTVASTVLWGR